MNTNEKISGGTAYVVDDDVGILDVMSFLLETVQVTPRCFTSPFAFLDEPLAVVPACAILDVRLPGVTGIEVLRILKQERRLSVPVIMLTGHGDASTAVRAMKLGAYDFVEKPVPRLDMVEVVQRAIRHHAETARFEEMRATVASRLARLSEREREILDLIVAGRSTKEIAEALSISTHTVDNHRAKVMQKMMATSIADLVRMICATAPVPPL